MNSIMDRIRQLARSGRVADGIALVGKLSEEGDPEACFILANWRLWGFYGERDLAQCHALLERAGQAGFVEASRLRAILTANGTGRPSDVVAATQMLRELAPGDPDSARQLELLDLMDPGSRGGLETETLSDDPPIRLLRNLLSVEECRYLMDKAQPALRPSMIIDPNTKRPVPNPVRTSSGMNFDPSLEDLVVHAINRRIAAATETPVECGELLHVLQYRPGEQFRPHLDSIPGAANQRHWTALVYLNEGYEAGGTVFTELGVEAKGGVGDCLIFRNSIEGASDPRTRHAGRPVTSGVKWLASRWIRQQPVDPFELPH
jgi:prolyl 4-hydroxylase